MTKEKPTSDGCSQGRRRSEDRKRCLDPVFLGDNPAFPPLELGGR